MNFAVLCTWTMQRVWLSSVQRKANSEEIYGRNTTLGDGPASSAYLSLKHIIEFREITHIFPWQKLKQIYMPLDYFLFVEVNYEMNARIGVSTIVFWSKPFYLSLWNILKYINTDVEISFCHINAMSPSKALSLMKVAVRCFNIKILPKNGRKVGNVISVMWLY